MSFYSKSVILRNLQLAFGFMVLVQVRYTFVKGNLKLEMPSPFSVVIQVCLPSKSLFPPVL